MKWVDWLWGLWGVETDVLENDLARLSKRRQEQAEREYARWHYINVYNAEKQAKEDMRCE